MMSTPWGREGVSNSADENEQEEGGRGFICKWTSLSVQSF